jgi:hypothetical protein
MGERPGVDARAVSTTLVPSADKEMVAFSNEPSLAWMDAQPHSSEKGRGGFQGHLFLCRQMVNETV